MEAPFCLLMLVMVVASGTLWAGGDTFETLIIGGHEVIPRSRPYMVSLKKAGAHLCVGVLVHPQWVLTAAHCVTQPTKLRLVLGLHALREPGLALRVSAAVLHPEFKKPPHLEHDLALLKLDRKVRRSRTSRPLALPPGRQKVVAGTLCSVVGWGLTQQDGQLARVLRELEMHVLDARMCNNSRFWHGDITPYMLCLEATSRNRAPCKQGDSGGPLMCGKDQVAGILSFSSPDCTDIFKPHVATAVAPMYPGSRRLSATGLPHLRPEAPG